METSLLRLDKNLVRYGDRGLSRIATFCGAGQSIK